MFRTVDNIKYIYNNTIYCTVCNIHQSWATHFSSVFFLNLSISPAKLSKIIFETLCIFGSKLFYGQLISDSKALGFSKSSGLAQKLAHFPPLYRHNKNVDILLRCEAFIFWRYVCPDPLFYNLACFYILNF